MKYKFYWPVSLAIFLLILSSVFSYRRLKHRAKNERKTTFSKLPKIIDKPIKYGLERKILMAIYREKHTGDCKLEKDGLERCIYIVPNLIVIHMTAIDNFEDSFNSMYYTIISSDRKNLLVDSDGDQVNVSAHFLIDKDGKIYRLMSENYEARHAIGVNHLAIGIENVGFLPTKAQVEANIQLIKYLLAKYPSIKGILAHGEISRLRDINSELFVEKQKDYFKPKHCGIELMRLLRENMHIKDIFIRE